MFFFKQKTAYEMRISDWSSDVCSSDLAAAEHDLAAWPAVQHAFERSGGRVGTKVCRHRRAAAAPGVVAEPAVEVAPLLDLEPQLVDPGRRARQIRSASCREIVGQYV